MLPVDIKSIQKRVRAQERRRFLPGTTTLAVGFACALLAGGFWTVFFSRAFDIRDIAISGLETIDSGTVRERITSAMDAPWLGYLRPHRNIFFFDAERMRAEFQAQFPVLKSIRTEKHFFHGLVFRFIERKPMGVWCLADRCVYFDDEGVTWGPAGRSSGFLFLTVVDNRSTATVSIAPAMLIALRQSVEGVRELGMAIRRVEIPAGSFDEIRIVTDRGYPIRLSMSTDIPAQFAALSAFVAQKRSDPAFAPQYIDLRVLGRIYYK